VRPDTCFAMGLLHVGTLLKAVLLPLPVRFPL
jgi:hypothetical protein